MNLVTISDQLMYPVNNLKIKHISYNRLNLFNYFLHNFKESNFKYNKIGLYDVWFKRWVPHLMYTNIIKRFCKDMIVCVGLFIYGDHTMQLKLKIDLTNEQWNVFIAIGILKSLQLQFIKTSPKKS